MIDELIALTLKTPQSASVRTLPSVQTKQLPSEKPSNHNQILTEAVT